MRPGNWQLLATMTMKLLSSPHNLWVTIPRWKTHLCKVKCKTPQIRPVYCSVKQGCQKKVTYSTQNFTRLNKYSNSHGLAVMDNFNYNWPHKFAERLWALPGSCIHCPGAALKACSQPLVWFWYGLVESVKVWLHGSCMNEN